MAFFNTQGGNYAALASLATPLAPLGAAYLAGGYLQAQKPVDYSGMSDEQAQAAAMEAANRAGNVPFVGGSLATKQMGAFQSYMAFKGLKALQEKPVPFSEITPEQARSRAEKTAQGWSPQEIAAYEQQSAQRSAAAYQRGTAIGGGSMAAGIQAGIQAQNIAGLSDFAAKGAELRRQDRDTLTQQILSQENLKQQQQLDYRLMQEKAYGGALAQGQQNYMQGLMGKSAIETQLASSVIGAGAQAVGQAAGSAAGAAALSDIRLKRDISYLGRFKGHNIYSYKYLWSDEEHTGVMAQEVEQTRPDCVIEVMGYKAVNYSKLFF